MTAVSGMQSWFDAMEDHRIEMYIEQWTADVERLSEEAKRKQERIKEAKTYLERRRRGDKDAQYDPNILWP